MKSKIIVLVLALLFFVSAATAVPMAINVQGRLTNAAGVPITSSTRVFFGIYSSSVTDIIIWGSKPYTIQPDANGIFNVEVYGDAEHTTRGSFPDFLTDDYYLEVTIDSVGALAPRQRLVSVPFAITAKNVKYSADIGVYASGESAGGNFESSSRHGVGVRGSSSDNIGVSGNGAVQGGFFESDNGTGVRGYSNNVGVSGFGTIAGGSFESFSGKGIYAYSRDVFGVEGYSSSGSGIYGHTDGTTAAGVSGIGNGGYGVWGNGGSGTGVYGSGATAGGSFESTDGVGVRASSQGQAAIVGVSSAAGGTLIVGLRGSTYSPAIAAVEGNNTGVGPGIGVRGLGGGTGVYGSGSSAAGGKFESTGGAGVIGRGATAGGSFESDSGSGVFGKGNIGVSGRGVTAGGSFESTNSDGIGLFASSIAAGNYDSKFKVKTFSVLRVSSTNWREVFNVTGATIFAVIGYKISAGFTAPLSFSSANPGSGLATDTNEIYISGGTVSVRIASFALPGGFVMGAADMRGIIIYR